MLEDYLQIAIEQKGLKNKMLKAICTYFFCSVFNVQSVEVDVLNVTFTTTQDHSKWAVSNPKQGLHWLCVGDINRMVCIQVQSFTHRQYVAFRNHKRKEVEELLALTTKNSLLFIKNL